MNILSEFIHEGKDIGERVQDISLPAFAPAKNKRINRLNVTLPSVYITLIRVMYLKVPQ